MKIQNTMKHVKLFESWDESSTGNEIAYRAPNRNSVPDLSPLKDTAEYQDLIAAGFTDVSDNNPMGLKMGNLRFAHPALGEDTIRVNQVGSISIDKPSGKTIMVDRGPHLMSIEDYAARLTTLPQMLPQS
jgi:hypothetical protein